MIVSDAGPIIIFARIGRLSLLREVTGFLGPGSRVRRSEASGTAPILLRPLDASRVAFTMGRDLV